jgi:hypothetical protein
MIEKGPRDRAVSIGSKEALVQTRRESAKQLTFTNGPFGRTTKQVMTEIAEGFTKKLRPVGECFYDVEGLGQGEDTSQPQQEFLPHSMARSQF